MILLNGSVPIAFAGTEEPAAYGELISIGGIGPSVNGKLSSTIAEILETKLSIDSSRFYIKFYDVQVSTITSSFVRMPQFCDYKSSLDYKLIQLLQLHLTSLQCWMLQFANSSFIYNSSCCMKHNLRLPGLPNSVFGFNFGANSLNVKQLVKPHFHLPAPC